MQRARLDRIVQGRRGAVRLDGVDRLPIRVRQCKAHGADSAAAVRRWAVTWCASRARPTPVSSTVAGRQKARPWQHPRRARTRRAGGRKAARLRGAQGAEQTERRSSKGSTSAPVPPQSATSHSPARNERVASTIAAAPEAHASDIVAQAREPRIRPPVGKKVRQARPRAGRARRRVSARIRPAASRPALPKRRGARQRDERPEGRPARLDPDEDSDSFRRRVVQARGFPRLAGRGQREREPPVAGTVRTRSIGAACQDGKPVRRRTAPAERRKRRRQRGARPRPGLPERSKRTDSVHEHAPPHV